MSNFNGFNRETNNFFFQFSPTVPLKEFMYIRFRESGKKKNILGLYFDMGCDMYGYGLKIYNPSAAGMEDIRAKIEQNASLCCDMLEDLCNYGFAIRGKEYKTDHFSHMKEGVVKDLLNMSNFELSISKPVNESVYSNLLLTELSDAFIVLKPFIELLAE